MIAPDDPRHGKLAGYSAGCHEPCCRYQKAIYEKRREWDRLNGRPRLIDPTGTRRRIEALQWLGYSLRVIARECGWETMQAMQQLMRKGRVTVATAERVDAAYRRLCMTIPPHNSGTARARNHARRMGFASPLAWDDIDNDPAPHRGTKRNDRLKTDLDPVVVERVLAGDRLPMTRAERVEVVRTALARGWSESEIEARTGITKATDKSRFARPDEEDAA